MHLAVENSTTLTRLRVQHKFMQKLTIIIEYLSPELWLIINPLEAIGICLDKQKFMYSVLAPSIITPILYSHGLLKALDKFVSVAG